MGARGTTLGRARRGSRPGGLARIARLVALVRAVPAARLARSTRRWPVIAADLQRWIDVEHPDVHPDRALRLAIACSPAFRTVLYWRMGPLGRLIAPLYPGTASLHLRMSPDRVGPGLYVQHGEGTFIGCRRIGRDAWINQGVTLGFSNNGADCPTLGDGVTVSCGAKVLGGVTVGDGVHVGANAVVTRSVPAGSLVAPPTSRIITP